MKGITLRDLGLTLLVCFGFLWLCAWLKLTQYSHDHPDAFKQYLIDNQCYATARKVDPVTHRKSIEYHCESGDDRDPVLYEQTKGPGEK